MRFFALFGWSSIFFLSVAAHGASVDGIPWQLVGPQILNFTLFLALIIFILVKKVQIKAIFAKRFDDYNTLLHQAEMEKKAVEDRKTEMAKKLEILAQESQEASEKAEREAELLKEQILLEARSLSDRYLKEAQRAAQQERDKAIVAMSGELLSTSMSQARSLLKERVDSSIQVELKKEFVNKVAGGAQAVSR